LLKLRTLLSLFGQARRGTVALIIALALPALLAAAGLAVDIGYWYQQQESLQSAADSAALTAAKSYINYSVNSLTGAEPYAVAAANNATNNQFGLTTTTLTLSGGGTSTGADNASITAITATAKIPRRIFFSGVAGMGLSGMGAGYQYASATADVVKTPSAPCGLFDGVITVSGGGLISGTNCAIDDNDTNCPSISVSGSGVVDGSDVATAASCVSSPQYSGYIGNKSTEADNGSNSTTLLNQAQVSDPLASMGTPVAFPAFPAIPGASSTPAVTYTNVSLKFGYQTSIYCTSGAVCTVPPGDYSGMSSLNTVSVELNAGSSNAGTTDISGGLGGNFNTGLYLDGNNYYIAGTNSGGSVSSYAADPSAEKFTVGGSTTNGTYYFNGGVYIGGDGGPSTFAQGFYMFQSYSSSTAAFDDNDSAVTFTGGTYFFNGGLTVEGSGSVTFGPGIYYIENGPLNFIAGSKVTVNGATFVLEGNAYYEFDGGYQGINLTAPSSNCVTPSSYPESQYVGTAPYDGTDGEGICGILIYQARTDTAADTIDEGATSTITGSIYAPDAALTVSGGATLNLTSSNGSYPALEQTSIADSGSGTINLTEPAGGAGNNNETVALLVQ